MTAQMASTTPKGQAPCRKPYTDPRAHAPAKARMNHELRAGPGCLNIFSASISGASTKVRLPSGGQRREVGSIGCHAVKARVWTPAIIKVQVAADRSAGRANAVVGLEIVE